MDFFLGVDSGGTRTRALLVDASGRELARAEGDSIKLLRVSRADAEARLSALLAQIETSSGMTLRQISSCCVGMSGYGVPEWRSAMQEILASRLGCTVTVRGDEEIAMAAAKLGRRADVPLVLLIAGTGSHAIAVSAGREARAGGWGPALGDEGGGSWLGREACRLAVREFDASGRRGKPALLQALCVAWDVSGVEEFVARAHSPTADFAALVPVLAAAENCRPLLLDAGKELARLVVIAAGNVSPPVIEVAWTGSILREIATVRSSFEAELRAALPATTLDAAETDPLQGAVALARNGATERKKGAN